MSDKNKMKHMGITDQDIIGFFDLPTELEGNEDIDFYASYDVYLGNLKANDPNSESLFEGQLMAMMTEVSAKTFIDCSYSFREIASSDCVVEMRNACEAIHGMYS